MNRQVTFVAIALLAAGGYFYASTSGMFGGGLSAEATQLALTARAKEINDSGDLKYDDFSVLTAAKVEGLTLTIEAKSLLDGDKIGDSYLESRKGQAKNKLCSDEGAIAILAAGATYIYNWVSQDGEAIGTVTAAPDFCAG